MSYKGHIPLTDGEMLEYLRTNVRIDEECRIWAGPHNGGGYPRITWHGKQQQVTRLIATLTGRMTSPMGVTWMACETPLCVAELHLRCGSRAQMMQARRSRMVRGTLRSLVTAIGRAKNARMSIRNHADVARMRAEGKTFREIAEVYGVTESTASKCWRAWQRAGVAGNQTLARAA